MSAKSGTFLVRSANEESAVLADVADGQVHTLSDNPGLAADDVIEATIAPEPPLEVVWTVESIDESRTVAVETSDERPTKTSRDLAATMDPGDLQARERAGTGTIHVISIPEDRTDDAVADVLEDETTRRMAARLGVGRVEVRSSPGVVTVRYLP